MLKNWKGTVEVDGVSYSSMQDVLNTVKIPANGNIHILLKPMHVNPVNEANSTVTEPAKKETEYRITVKRYMTKPSEPGFDFMEKWNNNKPMPLVTMTGTILQETKGMVKMRLHGDIWAKKICTCMCCGRPLTNPVSQYFGIGPECGGHNYVHPFNTDEELQQAVAEYKAKLQATTWEGWVIKSAITEKEEI